MMIFIDKYVRFNQLTEIYHTRIDIFCLLNKNESLVHLHVHISNDIMNKQNRKSVSIEHV
jgi:hypothetical protein